MNAQKPFSIKDYSEFTNNIRTLGERAEREGFVAHGGRFLGLKTVVEIEGEKGRRAPVAADLIISTLPENSTQLGARIVSNEIGTARYDGMEPRGTVGVKSFDIRDGDVRGMTRIDGTAPELVDKTLEGIMGPTAEDGHVDFDAVGKLAAVAEAATEFAVQLPNGDVQTYPLADLQQSNGGPAAPVA